MQKDVIYIDVDDDITTVIGKVKLSKHKIVALVPPKRVGMLQSAVNLRLLNRAAEQKDKKLVLISNNLQLTNLAGMTGIPVAKTLQSKPELAQIDALDIDNGEEVIDGSELPIGEHVKQAQPTNEFAENAPLSAVGAVAVTSSDAPKAVASPGSAKKPRVKNGKVPNFDTFRKRLVLIIVGSILLIGFLVWAIFFAPHANVIVKMRTTDAAVSQQVTLSTSADTSAKNSVIRAEVKQLKKDVSVALVATGKKNVGEKSAGKVEFSQQSLNSRTVEAGTSLRTSGGLLFTLDSEIIIPASKFGPPNCFPTACPGSATGMVTASEPGVKYNAATGSLSGAGGGVSASFAGVTAGGTDKTVKVATKEDIDKAETTARDSVDKNVAKTELEKQFGDSFVVIKDSLQVDTAGVKSSVAPDEEVTGDTAKVAGPVNYSLYAIEKTELKNYLTAVLEQQLDDSGAQRVYSSGADEASFTGIDRNDKGLSVNISTNGSTGPNITEDAIKTLAKGKRYGEVKSAIEAINGVQSTDVEFSPFWVRKVPNNTAKISVEFKVNGKQ